MSDLSTTIDQYLDAWNETDAARRADLIAAVWADDGALVDPPLDGHGHAGIDAMASALQAQFPGHRFRRASGVDAHHEQFRFAWELVAPDGAPVLAGVDVGALAPDGRLQRITGFFGELPAKEVV
jgi:hypothetical protein